MAINKTVFTAARAAQKSEILEWLQSNATSYFDEIDENSGNIECSLENGAKLTFVFDDTGVIYKIDSKTGNSHSIYSGSALTAYTTVGIATSNGIMLISNATSSAENVVIITKTNTNSTAIAAFAKTASGSSSSLYHYFIDLTNDTDWLGTSNSLQKYLTPMTTLTPVCFSFGTYCEHVFITTFTQFDNTCIMQIDDKKFAYGGYLALEE